MIVLKQKKMHGEVEKQIELWLLALMEGLKVHTISDYSKKFKKFGMLLLKGVLFY